MITNTNAPAMPHETAAGRARVRARAKAGRLDSMPAWKLARTSGATWREAIDVVLAAIRALHGGGYLPLHWTLLGHGEDEAPDTEGPIPGGLSVAERAAIRGPLGRYAAARAAGYDDARAREHTHRQWAERITIGATERAQADRTAIADGLVWVPAGRGVRRAAIAPHVVTVIHEKAGTAAHPRWPVLGWWCLPSVTAVLGGGS